MKISKVLENVGLNVVPLAEMMERFNNPKCSKETIDVWLIVLEISSGFVTLPYC